MSLGLFSGCSKPKYPDYDPEQPISVMSFNGLNGYGNNKNYSDPEIRQKWVVEIAKERDPDLIGFQEIRNDAIAWWEELHHDLCTNGTYDHKALDKEEDFMILSGMTTGAGLMIFRKADRFEYMDSGCYEYTYYFRQVRYFQWVKLYDRIYDKDILITNTPP